MLISSSRMRHNYWMFHVRSHSSPLPSPPFWSQAAELAPTLQTDIEVKEAIQGAIQGENGEVVQIVTSVATWEPCLVHLSPRTLPYYSMAWRTSMQQQRSMNAYSMTSNQVSKPFQQIMKVWWNTGKKEFFCCFFFLPENCSINCQPDVSMWKSQRLEKDYDPPKSTVVFLVFSSPEGPGPPQNTQWDYCLSREDAAYADHHPATSSAHTLVYINFGK